MNSNGTIYIKSIKNLPYKYLKAIFLRPRSVLYLSSGIYSMKNYRTKSIMKTISRLITAILSLLNQDSSGPPNAA